MLLKVNWSPAFVPLSCSHILIFNLESWKLQQPTTMSSNTPSSGGPRGSKRKWQPTNLSRDPKRAKVDEARRITTQPTNSAFNNGELNVDQFVRSREFEIRALEEGIKSSKHALSTRAHQEVPRDLRRRTASHNVKRVPRRLRARLAREASLQH